MAGLPRTVTDSWLCVALLDPSCFGAATLPFCPGSRRLRYPHAPGLKAGASRALQGGLAKWGLREWVKSRLASRGASNFRQRDTNVGHGVGSLVSGGPGPAGSERWRSLVNGPGSLASRCCGQQQSGVPPVLEQLVRTARAQSDPSPRRVTCQPGCCWPRPAWVARGRKKKLTTEMAREWV